MRRVLRAGAVTVLVCAALLTDSALPSAPALAATPSPETSSCVVVLLAPYLTWEDIDLERTPTLARLAEQGALGCIAVRGGVRPGEVPDDLRGAAVMSAGQHVPRPTAVDIGDRESPYGLLGGAVADADGTTAAIGSGAPSLDKAGRPDGAAAYIVAMDRTGHVSLDLVGRQALTASPIAPLGVTADLDAYERLLRPLLASIADDPGSPALVVLDPGDGARARTAAEQGGSWDRLREAATRTVDRVAGIALSYMPADGVLMVVSTAQYEPGGVEGFGPLLVYGRGSGVLFSSRTRREGVVALPDVSATALSMLGLEAPRGMVGAPLDPADVPARDESALASMLRIDNTARVFDAPRMPIYYGFIGICLLVFLLALTVMAWPALRARRGLRRMLAVLVLVCLSVPLGTYLAQFAGYPATASGAWLRLGVGGAVAAAGTLLVAYKRGFIRAVGVVAAATTVVILVDQLVGAPLAYGGIFSYTPLFGTRYYGIGNEGAAVLVASALISAVLLADFRGTSRPWVILAVGAVVVVVAVAPLVGANVGVAAWGTAGFLACWAYRDRRRLTWQVVLGGAVAVVAVVALAAFIDRMTDAQSHLGAAVDALLGGDGVGELFGRKVALNIEALTTTPVVVVLPLIMGVLAYALARPRAWVASFVEEHRGFAAVLVGALAAALVGAFSEDSGVSVSAVVLLYGLGGPLVVALADMVEVAT